MKILIAGGTGFTGRSIIQNLNIQEDIEYHILTRDHKEHRDNVRYHQWDGETLGPWCAFIDQCDVVINLAGRSVKCRYNTKNKDEIYNSRIKSTYILGEAIAKSNKPPKLWINASTATIYRHETERANDEYNGVLGEGFSVDVARKWEEAFYAAYTPFTRKVAMRTAITFGIEAEVFGIYQNHINLHLSGRHGDGNQMVSWVHEYDLVNIIKHFIQNEECTGTYNVVAPNALSDAHFLKTFREIMGKPFGFNIPAWALEIGARWCNAETEMLLKSRWVYPKRLLEEGYTFIFPDAKRGLSELVQRKRFEQLKRAAA